MEIEEIPLNSSKPQTTADGKQYGNDNFSKLIIPKNIVRSKLSKAISNLKQFNGNPIDKQMRSINEK